MKEPRYNRPFKIIFKLQLNVELVGIIILQLVQFIVFRYNVYYWQTLFFCHDNTRCQAAVCTQYLHDHINRRFCVLYFNEQYVSFRAQIPDEGIPCFLANFAKNFGEPILKRTGIDRKVKLFDCAIESRVEFSHRFMFGCSLIFASRVFLLCPSIHPSIDPS